MSEFTFLRKPQAGDEVYLIDTYEEIRRSVDVMEILSIDPPFELTTGFMQSPNLWFDPDADDADVKGTIAEAEAKHWVRAMAKHARSRGYELEKISNSYEFGFRIKDTKCRFTVPTELSCKQVPVLDEHGEPIIEEVVEYQSVPVTTTKVRTQKECVRLVAPDEEI